ncbi:phosphoinositide phospholipase C 6-like protein [Tanacetum coccineum]
MINMDTMKIKATKVEITRRKEDDQPGYKNDHKHYKKSYKKSDGGFNHKIDQEDLKIYTASFVIRGENGSIMIINKNKEIRLWATSILSAEFVHLTHELIGIHVAKAKKGLRKVLTEGKGKRLSLYEQPLQNVASQYGTALFRFTQKNILRVLPKGTRVTFMNYSPLEAWIMVLRWLRLLCRGCGYVKKPDSLMGTGLNGDVFDLKAMIHVKKTLKVRVYMDEGWRMDFSYVHFDKFSPLDFYTKVFFVVGQNVYNSRAKDNTLEWACPLLEVDGKIGCMQNVHVHYIRSC